MLTSVWCHRDCVSERRGAERDPAPYGRMRCPWAMRGEAEVPFRLRDWAEIDVAMLVGVRLALYRYGIYVTVLCRKRPEQVAARGGSAALVF